MFNNGSNTQDGFGTVTTSKTNSPEILWDRDTRGQDPNEVVRWAMNEIAVKEETALIEALPGLWKSRNIPKVADYLKASHLRVSAFTNLTDNYDQLERWGEEDGVQAVQFPRFTKDCGVINKNNDDFDGPIARKMKERFKNGWSGGDCHDHYDSPCQRGDDSCGYYDALDEMDPDSMVMGIGHYTQAYKPSYVDDGVCFIDEDGLEAYITQEYNPFVKANAFLDAVDAPLDRIPNRITPEKCEMMIEWLENRGLDTRSYRDHMEEFHGMAPRITYAIFNASELNNGLMVADFPDNEFAVYEHPNSVTERETDPRFWHFNPPDLSNARAVIALDATPSVAKWKLLLGEDMKHYRLFNDEQRNQYLQEQGHDFVQIHSHAWPANGGNLHTGKCELILRGIQEKHGDKPDLVTSIAVEEMLKGEGLGHLYNEVLTFGSVEGKNDLRESTLLLVLGSPSRPDTFYQVRAALCGESMERTEKEGETLSPNNEVVADIISSTRRGGTFQAGMRAGRNEGVEATVHFATCLIPEWLDVTKVGFEKDDGEFDVCELHSDGMKEVMDVLRGADEMEPGELYDRSDLSRDRTVKLRQKLQRNGYVEKTGSGRWSKYSDSGLNHSIGEVDFSNILLSSFTYKGSIRRCNYVDEPPHPGRDPQPSQIPDWIKLIHEGARHTRRAELLANRARKADWEPVGKSSKSVTDDTEYVDHDQFGSWAPQPVDTGETDDMGEQQESVPDTGGDQESVTAGTVGAREEEITQEEFLYELQTAPPEVAQRRIREWKRKQTASSKS